MDRDPKKIEYGYPPMWDSGYAKYWLKDNADNKNLVDYIHKYILGNVKPDLTFILKVSLTKALQRLKKRKKLNRYDKFPKNFYIKVQKAFIKLAKKDKKRYFVLDNSDDSKEIEKIILNKFIKILNK